MHIHGSSFSLFIKFNLLDLTPTQLELFSWIDADDFKIQHVEFRSSEFMDMKICGTMEVSGRWKCRKVYWYYQRLNIFPEIFYHFEENLFRSIFSFGLTYSCMQIFSSMKAVWRLQWSWLTPKYSENFVKFNVTKYVATGWYNAMVSIPLIIQN